MSWQFHGSRHHQFKESPHHQRITNGILGCSSIVVTANEPLVGIRQFRASGRYGGVWNYSDPLDTVAQTAYNAWIAQRDHYMSALGYSGANLFTPWVTVPTWLLGDGGFGDAGVSNRDVIWWWRYDGATYADVGDGSQWYPSWHEWHYQVDERCGVLIDFRYTDSCGGHYVWSLDQSDGSTSETGTLVSAVHAAYDSGFWPGYAEVSNCPVNGVGTPFIDPSWVTYVPGSSITYDRKAWWEKLEVVQGPDWIAEDDPGYTITVQFGIAGGEEADPSDGFTLDECFARCRATLDTIDLTDLSKQYELLDAADLATAGNFGVLRQNHAYAILHSMHPWFSGYAHWDWRFVVVKDETPWSYAPSDGPPPRSPCAAGLWFDPDPGYAATLGVPCVFAVKSLHNVQSDNCIKSYHQTGLVTSYEEASGAAPQFDGTTDCIGPAFLSRGTHIVTPDDMIFQFGQAVLFLKVSPQNLSPLECGENPDWTAAAGGTPGTVPGCCFP